METVNDIEREVVTNCNGLNAVKACEVVAKWRDHLEFKFANGFGIDSAADIGRDMLACLDEIKQSISAPLNTNSAENVNSDATIYNAAKTREALELASRVIHGAIAADILKGDDAQTAFFACRAALSDPARNCDLYDLTRAKAEYKKYRTEICWRESNPFIANDETLPFDEWLFAEAKGDQL